ncbi:hypothetical protein LCL87_17110 [Rhodococcus hoagii]|nr:hypothetical protein [Prescottella equi]
MSQAAAEWLPDYALPLLYKVARADALSADLMDVLTDYGKSGDPLDLESRVRNGREYLHLTSVKQPPPLVGLLFGDAINQLRSTLDHAVLMLVEAAGGRELESEALRQTAFPICRDESKYNKWCRARKALVPELGPGTPLSERLRALQPFHPGEMDTDAPVPQPDQSMPLFKTPVDETGAPLVDHHPLIGLAEWSNYDKHRRLNVAVVRSVFAGIAVDPMSPVQDPSYEWHADGQRFEVGKDILSVPQGQLVAFDLYPYPAIQRPHTDLWRPIPAELHLYQRYVCEMVLPYLFTGVRNAGPMPSQAPLNAQLGRDALEGLQAGTYNRDSQERAARFMEMLDAANQRGNEVMRQLLGDE